MSDISKALGVDPTLSRMASADIAMVRAKAGIDAKRMAEIDTAAKDFESMFISELLAPMFDTVPVDSEFGGGQGEETWRGLMVQQYGKQIAASGGIGLADTIKAHMIQMQEAAQNEGGQKQ